jgi:hypothetical protein
MPENCCDTIMPIATNNGLLKDLTLISSIQLTFFCLDKFSVSRVNVFNSLSIKPVLEFPLNFNKAN